MKYEGERRTLRDAAVWFVTFVLIAAAIAEDNVKTSATNELPFCNSVNEDYTSTGKQIGDDGDDALRQNTVTILVSTIDGRITALDAKDGSLLWRHDTKPGPLLDSTLSGLKFTNGDKWVQFVPSLDGHLYTYDGEQISAVPLSMDALLGNSIKVADDTVVTGGKDITTYGIARSTGALKYVCGSYGCDEFHNLRGTMNDTDDVILIRRLTRTVRAISAFNGQEKWNYSVGQHEVNLFKNTLNVGCHVGQTKEHSGATIDIRFSVHDGTVFCTNLSSGSATVGALWKHVLSAPVVNAWLLSNDDLQRLDLFNEESHINFIEDSHTRRDPSVEFHPLLHMGTYRKQLYVHYLQNIKKLHELYRDPFGVAQSQIMWKPYLISANTRTPIIWAFAQNNDLTDISPSGENTALVARIEDAQYPYDNGFTLYTSIPLAKRTIGMNNSDEENLDTFDQIVITSLWYWWKEVLCISVVFAVAVNVFITKHVVHRMKMKFLKESSNQDLATIGPLYVANEKHPNVLLGSQKSDSSTSSMVTPVEFVSRYASDFEPIQKLGRGGFGVVFQARNKIDDCEYAIKRISMPNRNESQERIMREVKALAKLDHVGIVRYYNAWLEYPPSDWQDNINADDVLTPSESMTYEEELRCFDEVLRDQNAGGDSDVSRKNSRLINNNVISSSENRFSLNIPLKGNSIEVGSNDSFIVFKDSEYDDSKLKQKNSLNKVPNSELMNASLTKDWSVKFYNSDMSSEGSVRATEQPSWTYDSPFTWTKPEKTYLYIQMQLCRKASLKDWLNCHSDKRDRIEVLDYFHQIVSAVDYVHEQGLIHRDLKPSNIFFAQDGSIKVGDFGLAATMMPTVRDDVTEGEQTIRRTRHTNQVGTKLYMSPEQIAEEDYDHKVDIYSLGLIFFEMMVPFKTAMERIKVMMDARQLKFPFQFVTESPKELCFVQNLLAQSSKDRPCATVIKDHPLLQDFQPRPELLRNRRIRTSSRGESTSSLGVGFDVLSSET